MKLSERDFPAAAGRAIVLVLALTLSSPGSAQSAAAKAAVRAAGAATEMTTEIGVYLDHRGDGAIEFKPCGSKLCGHVVWVREGAPTEACGSEIIGDAVPVKDGVWDGGWILDPEIGQKFDVEITRLSDDEMQVMGYLGTKELSETFLWKKAPSDLQRCDVSSGVAAAVTK